MTQRIVRHAVTAPDSKAPLSRKTASVKLAGEGWVDADLRKIVGPSYNTSDSAGLVEFTLTPNDEIEGWDASTSTGTYYQLTEPGGEVLNFAITASSPTHTDPATQEVFCWVRDLLTVTPPQPGVVVVGLDPAKNLSDVASPATALTNLGGASSAALTAEQDRAEAAESALSSGKADKSSLAAETARAEAAEGALLPKSGGTLTGDVIAKDGTPLVSEAVGSSTYARTSRVATSPLIGGVQGLATYEPRLCAYNLASRHLTRTRAGLARAKGGTGFLSIACVGDSTTAGIGSGGVGVHDWPAQLSALLAGRGYPAASLMQQAWNNAGPDPRMTYGAGWAQVNLSTGTIGNTTTTNAWQIALTTASTRIRVYYLNIVDSGSFTVTIDGGAPATQTKAALGTVGVWDSGTIASANHTVSIARVSGSIYILGVEYLTNAASGVRVYNAGIGSLFSSQFVGSPFYSVIPAAAGVFGGSPGGFGADLMFLMTEVNDTATTVANYTTNLQTGITAAKANGSDVILGVSLPASGFDVSNLTGVLYQLADSNDVPLLDFGARWNNSYTLTNAQGLMYDTKHGTAAGYADYAAMVTQAIAA